MKRTEIAKLYASPESYTASPVTVCGWIRTNRDSKTLGFMELNEEDRGRYREYILS